MKIINFAQTLKNEKIAIHKRSEELSSDVASTDSLVRHALDLIGGGHILWTHVTSPFVNSAAYNSMIETYFSATGDGYDSLMSVNKLQGFFWDGQNPLNYDRAIEKWPRTQTTRPIYEINSAAFIAPAEIYQTKNDRIGACPYLFPSGEIEGIDIDWPFDFQAAELLLKNGVANV